MLCKMKGRNLKVNRAEKRRKRQELLVKTIGINPFLKDEDLAEKLGVSVATIRLDRTELGIAEYRERIKNVAKTKEDRQNDVGKVLDFNLYHNGTSALDMFDAPIFKDTKVIMSQALYEYAENLALSVINAESALIKVANIKYKVECYRGDKLLAKYEVMRVHNNEYIVWVKITREEKEVFRAKLNLSVTSDKTIRK